MALSFERRCGRLQHPDFLWSWLALTNFMRLSLMKAAHAVVSSAAYRKPRGCHYCMQLLQFGLLLLKNHGSFR
jgi:hypothetical protein